MPPKKEIAMVVAWLDVELEKENRLVIVVRNPFREKISWLYRYPFIEVNRPLEAANKNNLVYDSASKTLWHFMFGEWRKIEPDFEILE